MTINITTKYAAICISICFFLLPVEGYAQNNTSDKSYELVWQDEFNYTGAPDSTKWSFDLGDGCPNVGGNWGGAQGVDHTIWPQQMIVDYVRVYQKNE